jgi:hypothetical protein
LDLNGWFRLKTKIKSECALAHILVPLHLFPPTASSSLLAFHGQIPSFDSSFNFSVNQPTELCQINPWIIGLMGLTVTIKF